MLTPADVTQTMSDPSTAHAAVVHSPIVLTGVAALVALISAMLFASRRGWRWAALLACVAAAGSAWGAKITGERAHDAMGDPPITARQIANEHEELAEQMTLIVTGAAVLALGAWAPKRPLRAIGAWGAAIAAGAGAYWSVSAAHYGGQLVYDYGVGTPKPVTPFDAALPEGAPAPDPRIAFYKESVYPVLSQYCFSCHGSVESPAAGLSLTTPRALLDGGETGPAIVPGDPDASLLLQTMTGAHPTIFMPPDDDVVVTPDEIDAVRRWIADGAAWAAPD